MYKCNKNVISNKRANKNTIRQCRIISVLNQFQGTCEKGSTYGYKGPILWVSGSCSAIFVVKTIPIKGVRMLRASLKSRRRDGRTERRLSATILAIYVERVNDETICVLGEGYGYTEDNRVWVANGCWAKFFVYIK